MIGKFFDDAGQKFKEAGIAVNRVDIITTKRKDRAGKMILEQGKLRQSGRRQAGDRPCPLLWKCFPICDRKDNGSRTVACFLNSYTVPEK
jgi:hypothetical protein